MHRRQLSIHCRVAHVDTDNANEIMLKTLRLGSLAAVLLAATATLAFAQGMDGSAAANIPGMAGNPSTSAGSNFGNNAGGVLKGGGLSQGYRSAPVTPPGAQPTGANAGSSQSVTVGVGSRPNGAGSRTGTAGNACGLSLSDPASGTLTPLTPRLSPTPTGGGCE